MYYSMLLYRVKTGLISDINYIVLLDDQCYDVISVIKQYIPFDNPTKIFAFACKNGCRKIAELIYNEYDVNIKYDDDYALYYAFINGHHHLGLWLLDLYCYYVNEEILNYIFCKCCENGYLTTVKYIYQHFSIDVNMVDDYALRWATMKGHIDVVSWLLSITSFTEDGLRMTLKNALTCGNKAIIELLLSHYPSLENELKIIGFRSFIEVCRSGNIDTCRWFYNRYMVNLQYDIMSWNNLFGEMCHNGYKEVAQFILETIPETYSSYNGTRAIIEACKGGKLDIARWLLTIFNDKNIIYSEIFAIGCIQGYTNLCKWLYYEDKLDKTDVDYTIQFGFSNACRGGYLNLAKWLYSIKKVDLTSNCCLIFRICCERGYIELVEWLYETDPNIDIEMLSDYAFNSACKNNHIEVAQFLSNQCTNYSFEVNNGKIKSWRLNHELEAAKDLLNNECNKYDKVIQTIGITKSNTINCDICCICCICYEAKDRVVTTPCNHIYCLVCMLDWFITNNLKRNFKCACCRTVFNWSDCYDTVVYKSNITE